MVNRFADYLGQGHAQDVGVNHWDVDRYHRVAHTDFWMGQAVREIRNQYGDDVSIYRKAKSLAKFGRTANADNGVLTTVADFQDAVVNETFVTTNLIDSVVSTSGSDTETLVVEGHTIDGSGNLTFVVQEVTLTGQTPASLGTPMARANRAYVKNGTFASPASDLVGDVAIYDSTNNSGITSGKPDTDASVKAMIKGTNGKNQTEKCATSISQSDYWIITNLHCSIGNAAAAAAKGNFEMQVRQLGGVWRPIGIEIQLGTAALPFNETEYHPHIIVPPNSDVRLTVVTASNDVVAAGRMEGVLASIVT